MNKIRQMSNGQFCLVQTVPTMLLNAAQSRIEEPQPPTWTDDNGNQYLNTENPIYRAELTQWEERRNEATIYAVALMGLSLCDEAGEPVPVPKDWDRDLRLLGVDWKEIASRYFYTPKSGNIDSRVEEAVYIVLTCLRAKDMYLIGVCAGASEEEVAKSISSFQRAQERGPDSDAAHSEADTN